MPQPIDKSESLTDLKKLEIEIEFLGYIFEYFSNLENNLLNIINTRYSYIKKFSKEDDIKLFDQGGALIIPNELIRDSEINRINASALKMGYNITKQLSSDRERFFIDAIYFSANAETSDKHKALLDPEKDAKELRAAIACMNNLSTLYADIINAVAGEMGLQKPGTYKVSERLLDGITTKIALKNIMLCLMNPKIKPKWLKEFNDELQSPTNKKTHGLFKSKKKSALIELAQLFKRFIHSNEYDENDLKTKLENLCITCRKKSVQGHSDLADLIEAKFDFVDKKIVNREIELPNSGVK